MKREKRAQYIGPDMEVVKLTFQGGGHPAFNVPGMQPGDFPKDNDKPLFTPPAM